MNGGDFFDRLIGLLGGGRDVFTTHYALPSGDEGYRRVCASPLKGCGLGFPDCGRCHGGGYIPLTAEAFSAHIEGRAALGIYPAGKDGLCRFSAIELKGEDFRPKLQIIAALCSDGGLSHLCELTNFGEAGRLWLFFDSPMPAVKAAETAYDLLREAAVSVGGLPIEPWGRVWPTAAPPGGNGFPLTLPLFGAEKGFSSFAGDSLKPESPDILESVVPSPPADVSVKPDIGDFPQPIKAEICDGLYIDTSGISPRGLAALCSPAGIADPEPCRESLGYRPAFKYYAGLSARRLRLPRGVLEDLNAADLRLDITDSRQRTPARNGEIALSSREEAAVERILSRDMGTLAAPVGSGKTRLMCGVIAECGLSTLILTTESGAARRWRARISALLGLKAEDIPCITDDSVYPTGRLDVAVLGQRTGFWLAEKLPWYGLVIVADPDRLHCGADVFADIMESVCASRVYAVASRPTDDFPCGGLVRLYCGGDVKGIF